MPGVCGNVRNFANGVRVQSALVLLHGLTMSSAVQNFWLVRYVERDPVWTHRPPVKVRHGG